MVFRVSQQSLLYGSILPLCIPDVEFLSTLDKIAFQLKLSLLRPLYTWTDVASLCLLFKWDFLFFSPKDQASTLLEFLCFVKFDKAISE